jgi:uncharacterized protein (DUF2147 family)
MTGLKKRKWAARMLGVILLFLSVNTYGQLTPPAEKICGKWENKEKTLRIQIYTVKGNFLAKIIWFSDTEGKPMNYWKDKRNPDPTLRNRTILGMSILEGLRYDAEEKSWEDGKVYDSKHGKTWNASARIDRKGILKVRGYWHFKFIGKSMYFHRIN